MPIVEREEGGRQMCAYTCLSQHLQERKRAVPQCVGSCRWCTRKPGEPRLSGNPPESCRRAQAPLFTRPDGQAFSTEDVRQMGKRMAGRVGISPEAVGGKLFRIGGATDLLDRLGVGSSRIIQDRGRWGSEVARVYQRSLLRDQLDASGAMADADAADMEACIAGWVQPSNFR